MKAKELRIGNLINDEMIVVGVAKGTVWIKPKDYKTYKTTSLRYAQIKPIPLTEEWLLKFGFEKGRELYSLKDIADINWDKKVLWIYNPSLFSMTFASPPSRTATHELVVPRSIPIIFAIRFLRKYLTY